MGFPRPSVNTSNKGAPTISPFQVVFFNYWDSTGYKQHICRNVSTYFLPSLAPGLQRCFQALSFYFCLHFFFKLNTRNGKGRRNSGAARARGNAHTLMLCLKIADSVHLITLIILWQNTTLLIRMSSSTTLR